MPREALTAQAEACRHTGLESPADARRREDALAAVRLINGALMRGRSAAAYPTWQQLAESAEVASLRGMGGPMGDLARRIQWGTPQPLPAWRIRYLAAQDGYAFSLTDISDPCGFTYHSDVTGVIIEGHPVGRRRPGVIPIT